MGKWEESREKATISEARRLETAIKELAKVQDFPEIRDVKRDGLTVSWVIID